MWRQTIHRSASGGQPYAASVLNKTNGHLSCAAQALYEIGVDSIEAYRVVRNHLLMGHNVIEHSFSLSGKRNTPSPLMSCYVAIGCGETIRVPDDTSILNLRAHTHRRARKPGFIPPATVSTLSIQQPQITHFARNIIKADRRCP